MRTSTTSTDTDMFDTIPNQNNIFLPAGGGGRVRAAAGGGLLVAAAGSCSSSSTTCCSSSFWRSTPSSSSSLLLKQHHLGQHRMKFLNLQEDDTTSPEELAESAQRLRSLLHENSTTTSITRNKVQELDVVANPTPIGSRPNISLVAEVSVASDDRLLSKQDPLLCCLEPLLFLSTTSRIDQEGEDVERRNNKEGGAEAPTRSGGIEDEDHKKGKRSPSSSSAGVSPQHHDTTSNTRGSGAGGAGHHHPQCHWNTSKKAPARKQHRQQDGDTGVFLVVVGGQEEERGRLPHSSNSSMLVTSIPTANNKKDCCTTTRSCRHVKERQFRGSQATVWQTRFKELVEFKRQYGHCLVPYQFSKNRRLATWVKRQRYRRKERIKKNSNSVRTTIAGGGISSAASDAEAMQKMLTPEQQRRDAMLNSLGFVWDSHKAAWEEKYNELIEFQKEYGHTRVPWSYKNRSLAIWVHAQRRQWKRRTQQKMTGMAAAPSSLSSPCRGGGGYQQEEQQQELLEGTDRSSRGTTPRSSPRPKKETENRFHRLDALGFVWEPLKKR